MSKVFYLHTEPQACWYGEKRDNSRATIACTTDGQTIQYGYAICSPDDNFSRTKGREMAEKRMREGFGSIPFNNNWFNHFETPEAAMLNFATTLGKSLKNNYEKYRRRIAEKRGILPTPKAV